MGLALHVHDSREMAVSEPPAPQLSTAPPAATMVPAPQPSQPSIILPDGWDVTLRTVTPRACTVAVLKLLAELAAAGLVSDAERARLKDLLLANNHRIMMLFAAIVSTFVQTNDAVDTAETLRVMAVSAPLL